MRRAVLEGVAAELMRRRLAEPTETELNAATGANVGVQRSEHHLEVGASISFRTSLSVRLRRLFRETAR
jgi:hypothetical protein